MVIPWECIDLSHETLNYGGELVQMLNCVYKNLRVGAETIVGGWESSWNWLIHGVWLLGNWKKIEKDIRGEKQVKSWIWMLILTVKPHGGNFNCHQSMRFFKCKYCTCFKQSPPMQNFWRWDIYMYIIISEDRND